MHFGVHVIKGYFPTSTTFSHNISSFFKYSAAENTVDFIKGLTVKQSMEYSHTFVNDLWVEVH